MLKKKRNLKNELLYNGLEKEQYQAIEDSIHVHNKSMLRRFSGISLLLFAGVVIVSYGFHVLDYNRDVYFFAAFLSMLLWCIAAITNFENKRIYTYMSVVWIVLFVSISFAMAVSPTGINEKTTLFLVFPFIGPMFFCIPGGIFSTITVAYEILYIVVYVCIGQETPFYTLNIINTVVFTIVALIAGNTTMNVMAKSTYEAIKNLKTDELKKLHEEQEKRDILAKKRLSEALEEAKKADKAKSAFIFNMSHDIRTPMNAILGYANLLDRSEGLDSTQAKYVSGIISSGDQLLGLINNVLETARIESGKMELNETVLRCRDSEKAIRDVFGPMAESKNLELNIVIDIKHEYLYADPVKVNEIMFNLVSNAVKYTEKGAINITISEEEVDDTYSNYIFIVEDTGIGISEEFLPHIFESFSREQTVKGSKILGTGLGLDITKRLMALMHGTIEVESRLGVGTTFRCSMPNRISSKAEFDRNNKKQELVDSIDLKNMRVLLAEDNDLNADIAIAILGEFDISADWAKNGKECVDMLLSHDPDYYDVVLMDVQMPVMNGHEATRLIRKLKDDKKANIKIVAMTANAFEEDKQRCIEAGMDGFISKPIEVAKMIELLASIVK